MAKKINIELTPYNAVAILSFLREYFNEETEGDYQFKAMQDATAQYEQEIYAKLSPDLLDDAMQENEVNRLIGKWPKTSK